MDPKDFTTEDWFTVLKGVSAVTGLIMVSDLSGPVGFMKEATAGAEVLRDAKWQTPFIAALRAEMMAPTKEGQQELQKLAQAQQQEFMGQKMDRAQVLQVALDSIKNSIAFVGDKAGPEAAAEFKQVLGEIAQRTAGASKEGGFLGIGGVAVSPAEQAALDQIKAVLGA